LAKYQPRFHADELFADHTMSRRQFETAANALRALRDEVVAQSGKSLMSEAVGREHSCTLSSLRSARKRLQTFRFVVIRISGFMSRNF